MIPCSSQKTAAADHEGGLPANHAWHQKNTTYTNFTNVFVQMGCQDINQKYFFVFVHVFMFQRIIHKTYHITMIKNQQVMKLPIPPPKKKSVEKTHGNSSTTSGIRFTTSGISSLLRVLGSSCDVRCHNFLRRALPKRSAICWKQDAYCKWVCL